MAYLQVQLPILPIFKIGIVELIHDYPKMKKAGLQRTLIGISIIF